MKSIRRWLLVATMMTLGCSSSRSSQQIAVDSQGQLDAVALRRTIEQVEPYIREYPPRFKDERHAKELTEQTRQIASALARVDLRTIKDPVVVVDIAHFLAMAHNLDLGTGDLAKDAFEYAIELAPDSRRANYLFGMFLVSTRASHFESFPYLQKAYALGETDASYTIGLLLVERGDKAEGLGMLEHYAKEHPGNQRVQKMIEGIKNGTLTFQYSG